jgi:hypothetical protein
MIMADEFWNNGGREKSENSEMPDKQAGTGKITNYIKEKGQIAGRCVILGETFWID